MSGHVPPEYDILSVLILNGRLHTCLLLTGANQTACRAAADQETKGTKYDGLAGSGLTREYCEPRLQVELDLVNNSEVLDAQKANHQGKLTSHPECGARDVLADMLAWSKRKKFHRIIRLTAEMGACYLH